MCKASACAFVLTEHQGESPAPGAGGVGEKQRKKLLQEKYRAQLSRCELEPILSFLVHSLNLHTLVHKAYSADDSAEKAVVHA